MQYVIPNLVKSINNNNTLKYKNYGWLHRQLRKRDQVQGMPKSKVESNKEKFSTKY